MTAARQTLVDSTVTPYYHCISRCVRRAFLCGEGTEDRKQWIEDRLKLLTGSFSIGVGGFSVMNNHLHVLVRLEPEPCTLYMRTPHWDSVSTRQLIVELWVYTFNMLRVVGRCHPGFAPPKGVA